MTIDFGNVQVLHKYKSKPLDLVLKRLNSRRGILVEGWLYRSFECMGFEMNSEYDNKSVYNPEDLYPLLALYGRKPRLSFEKGVFHDAVNLAFKAFGSDGNNKLRALNLSETIDHVRVDTSSGFPNFISKGEALPSDLILADDVSQGLKLPPPCISYFRTQHGDSGPKTRLVWGYPLSMTLLETRYGQPLISHFLKARTPIAFGLHKHQLFARMVPIVNAGLRYNVDFSKFDTSVPGFLIHIAFEILSTHFLEVDSDFQLIEKYFIHTPIVMPDGRLYKKHSGVPSGSLFTQLIDSIVNYIVIQYCVLRALGKPIEEEKIVVLGDDSLFGIDVMLHLGELSKYASELGFTMSPLKCKFSRFGENVFFLGHDWVRGIPDRPQTEVVVRMTFPERPSAETNPILRTAGRTYSFVADCRCAHGLLMDLYGFTGTIISRYTLTEMDIPSVGLTRARSPDENTFNDSRLAYLGLLT